MKTSLIVLALLVAPFISFAVDCSVIPEACANGPLPHQWGDAPRFWDATVNAWMVDITGTQYYRDQMTKLRKEMKEKGFCSQFPTFAEWCK